MNLNFERFTFDIEPIKVLFISEPYVYYTRLGFAVAADIFLIKKKHKRSILLSAMSLSKEIFNRMAENNNKLENLEVWIYKESNDRKAKYIIED